MGLPGMSGDGTVGPSGDLAPAVALNWSEYVPLHDAARDLDVNELLLLPGDIQGAWFGLGMLSMLGYRWMVDDIGAENCAAGGGDENDVPAGGEDERSSRWKVSPPVSADWLGICSEGAAAAVGMKNLAPVGGVADAAAGLL